MESSYPPKRHRIDAGAISLVITLAGIIASLAAGWTVLDEARKTQHETIVDLRGRVAVLEAERLAAARLEERMAGFQRTLAKIETAVERLAQQEPPRRHGR